jgi:hypothetical protein
MKRGCVLKFQVKGVKDIFDLFLGLAGDPLVELFLDLFVKFVQLLAFDRFGFLYRQGKPRHLHAVSGLLLRGSFGLGR